MANRIDQKDAIAFIKGGKAKFVLHTLKSDKQFRYKVVLKKKTPKFELDLWWIYIEDDIDVYVGFITENNNLRIRTNPQFLTKLQQAIELLKYTWQHLQTQDLDERLHILHLGYCGVCGRALKDAHSLEIGIGPECLKRIS